jgi:hypothetical protein
MQETKRKSNSFLVFVAMAVITIGGFYAVYQMIVHMAKTMADMAPSYHVNVHTINQGDRISVTYYLPYNSAIVESDYRYAFLYDPQSDIPFLLDAFTNSDDGHFVRVRDRMMVDQAFIDSHYDTQLFFAKKPEKVDLSAEERSYIRDTSKRTAKMPFYHVSFSISTKGYDGKELSAYLSDQSYWTKVDTDIAHYTSNGSDSVDPFFIMP